MCVSVAGLGFPFLSSTSCQKTPFLAQRQGVALAVLADAFVEAATAWCCSAFSIHNVALAAAQLCKENCTSISSQDRTKPLEI
jgi:hypothetical protein